MNFHSIFRSKSWIIGVILVLWHLSQDFDHHTDNPLTKNRSFNCGPLTIMRRRAVKVLTLWHHLNSRLDIKSSFRYISLLILSVPIVIKSQISFVFTNMMLHFLVVTIRTNWRGVILPINKIAYRESNHPKIIKFLLS